MNIFDVTIILIILILDLCLWYKYKNFLNTLNAVEQKHTDSVLVEAILNRPKAAVSEIIPNIDGPARSSGVVVSASKTKSPRTSGAKNITIRKKKKRKAATPLSLDNITPFKNK